MLDFISLYVMDIQYEFTLFPVQKAIELQALFINFAKWHL